VAALDTPSPPEFVVETTTRDWPTSFGKVETSLREILCFDASLLADPPGALQRRRRGLIVLTVCTEDVAECLSDSNEQANIRPRVESLCGLAASLLYVYG
jgi:hypothetical protein